MKSDYYPFGMQMPAKSDSNGITINGSWHTDEYRFGYNGMEKDQEVKGDGNSYTTEFRQYDPRLGRWMSLDPLMGDYPSQSPYNAFNDNPVFFIDPLGLEGTDWIGKKVGNSTQWEYDPSVTSPDQLPEGYTEFAANGTFFENFKDGNYVGPATLEVDGIVVHGQSESTDLEGVEIIAKRGSPSNAEGLFIQTDYSEQASRNPFYNANLNFFADGFTTTNPETRYFDPAWRTSAQISGYKSCDNLQKGALVLAVVVASGGLAAEAGTIYNSFLYSDATLGAYISMEGAASATVNTMSRYWIGRVALTGGSLYTGSNLYNMRTAPGPLPSVFRGYGLGGKNGINIRNYKIEILYAAKTPGTGTYLSIKQQVPGGNMLRWDYGQLHGKPKGVFGVHSTFRYNLPMNIYGGSKQYPGLAPLMPWLYKQQN